MTTRTQRDKVREWLESGWELTPLDALDRMGCFRLGARIYELRAEGLDIEKRMVKTPGGAVVAAYRLKLNA